MSDHQRRWDLLVIGGGTAGIVGSTTAARLGARVALLEQARTGGDCLWTGCIPSKALLAAASAAATARRAPALGVRVQGVDVDFPAVMAHLRRAIGAIAPVDSPEALRRAGVHVLAGRGTFLDGQTVEADGQLIGFRRALVATGSRPVLPEAPGLAEAAPLTTETIWDLESRPGRMVVIGGGSTGCELGQGFARLGCSVTIVQRAPRLLVEEDPEASRTVHRALEDDGVRVLLGHTAVSVSGRSGEGGQVEVEGRGERRPVPFDILLVAAGRRAGIDGLGLERAGVRVDGSGAVRVDATLRTSNPRIWAAGDVTQHPRYTHVAGVHGSLAAVNAVLGLRRQVDLDALPRVTFTDPEVAAVGAATWSRTGSPPRAVTRQHDTIDRAVTDGRCEGFTRLVLDRRHRVIGATLVGPRAGEALAEVTLAVRGRLSTGSVTGAMHAYPTYADGTWNAAIDDVLARLRTPLVRGVLRLLVRVRAAAHPNLRSGTPRKRSDPERVPSS